MTKTGRRMVIVPPSPDTELQHPSFAGREVRLTALDCPTLRPWPFPATYGTLATMMGSLPLTPRPSVCRRRSHRGRLGTAIGLLAIRHRRGARRERNGPMTATELPGMTSQELVAEMRKLSAAMHQRVYPFTTLVGRGLAGVSRPRLSSCRGRY